MATMVKMQFFGLLIGLLILLGGCRDSNSSGPPAQSNSDPSALAREETTPAGFLFQLSEGSPDSGAANSAKTVDMKALDQAQVNALLKRLPDFKAKPQVRDFAMREKSLGPPRTGQIQSQPFPPTGPPSAPPEESKKAVEVLRFAPEGEVPIAPQLSVTFNQPMVTVTSHEELAKKAPPVKLEPQPEGTWRWIGTRTVLFDPRGEVSAGSEQEARFPMATEYKVELAKDLKSASGTSLQEPKQWSFSTPTVTLTGSAPNGGPHALEPLIWASFNQDIDPEAVLKTMKLSSESSTLALRLAGPEETKKAGLEHQGKKRWIALKAEERLKPATTYTVSIGPGTPSAEGPLLTKDAQSFSFSTYEPLKVEEHGCGYNDTCPPLSPFYIRFNNPIDPELFDPAMVKVSPEIPNLRIEAQGNAISIRGQTKGRTTYTVTLDGKIPDSFGQTLGKSQDLSFKVGSAEAQLSAPGELLVNLDPGDKGSYPVYCINESRLTVTVHSVEPKDWKEFQERLARETDKEPFRSPGQEMVNTSIETGAKPDELTEVRIDLKPALQKGYGMAVVVVETPRSFFKRHERKRIVKWVQATDVGIDAAVDHHSMQVMTSDLKTGKTLPGVSLKLMDAEGKILSSHQSDKTGSVAIPLLPQSAQLLVAELGSDVSILPQQASYYGYGGWQKSDPVDQLRWFVIDDRKMYRPDEKVSVKGWARRWQAGPQGDVVGLKGEMESLAWSVSDPLGNEVLKGNSKVSADGAFHLDFTLPKTINLGHCNLSLSASSSLSGSYHNHSFQVQEFRRPEFEVSAKSSPDSALVGESATATVEAKYYAGGGLPGAPVTWAVSSSQGSYSPPGHDGFTFGSWTPWWSWHGWRGAPSAPDNSKPFQSRTDSAGAHHLKLDFQSVDPPRPTVVTAEASVSDVNRQAWNSSTTILVHPSQSYVGLKSEKSFVEKGDKLEIEVLACNIEGELLENVPVEIAVWRTDYSYQRGQYKETRENLQTETFNSEKKARKVSFKTPEGGTYTVKARVIDSQGRANESNLTVWVSGAKLPAAKNLEKQTATLIPNQKEYRAGDVAEILLQSPFATAEGQLTYRRSGILKSERFSMKEASTILKVPIEEGYVPNLHIQVDLVGASGEKEKQPAYASGQLNLSIPPLARTLGVQVKPLHPATDPGSKTSLEVTVVDADGKPVPEAEVALFAVDEAVLALTGYQMPNPLDVFYSERSADTADYHSRQYVVLTKLEEMVDEELSDKDGVRGGGGNFPRYHSAEGLLGRDEGMMMESAAPSPAAEMAVMSKQVSGRASNEMKKESSGPPIKMRTDFNPTALFAPLVKTDAQGRAAIPFKLPDNLTRYRLVALATDGGRRFGKGESALVARLPLMVRPSAPRFLNFGDVFELPVVLQNQTDKAMDVQIAARSVNLGLTGAQGFSLQIPAQDRVEVRFPAAADRAGKADIQVGAVGADGAADAAEVSLPVWTPATTEAFATYGEIDEGSMAQKVKPPKDVFPQFGGLEITTSSTALQSLTDAFLYLTSYPFDCAEQVSSRLLGIAALRDVLWAFQAEGMPSEAALKEQVKMDMDRLSMLQQYNGGFGFWPTSGETWPYISVHVAHAMARAKEKGYEVPEQMLAQSQSYLSNVESYIPSWYHIDCQRMIRAYALYVRHRLGDTDIPKAQALIKETGGVTKLPIEALGWVYYVICKDKSQAPTVAEIRKFLNNSVTETAGNAHFVTRYDEEAGYVILSSDRRVDGIILEALIHDQADNDLIPKLARGLLAHRNRGQWGNTQDNCFVLLALDLYFQTYEKTTPDFIARAWLGEEFAGEQAFKGREVDSKSIKIPMSYLDKKGEQTLTLSKEGPGRLYYRLGMDYAPTSLKQEAADHGFAVERVYEGVDDPADVKQEEDGTWRIKAGAKVRVKLTMVATARRYHVALVDPLPAGLEPINPALAVSGTVPNDPGAQASRGPWWYWMSTWYEHQNMRDERVEAFTSLLWSGVYNYTYLARATTPGTFVVPPSKAEEMYAPETFGRSASDKVIIE